MSRSLIDKIEILKNTADRIANSQNYLWENIGTSNCGHLAQEVTHLSRQEIQEYAYSSFGHWNEQVIDHDPASGMPFDLIISEILEKGFTKDELLNLNRLSCQHIVGELPIQNRKLKRNRKKDVIIYINAWIGLLQKELFGDHYKRLAEMKKQPILVWK